MRSQKYLRIFWSVFAVATLVLFTVFIIRVIHDSSFKKAEATVARVYMVGTTPDSDGKYYAEYEFELDGERIVAKKQIFGKFGKTEGKTETVRYNPDDPTELENTMLKYSVLIAAGFVALITLLLTPAAWRKSNYRYKR